jgi:hypothetical protein
MYKERRARVANGYSFLVPGANKRGGFGLGPAVTCQFAEIEFDNQKAPWAGIV